MKHKKLDIKPPSVWQSIFAQSQVNGGRPLIDTSAQVSTRFFPFVRDTWLSRRLAKVRKERK